MTSFLEHDRVKRVIACDATGCEERRADKWRKPAYGLDGAFVSALITEGWSEWVGRSHRHYCPEHGPRPGNRMRLVWGNAR